MDAVNGVWGKIGKWLAGGFGAIGVAMVAYVVEHGELPAWVSNSLSWLSILMLTQTPWAFWELLVAVLGPSAALTVVIVTLLRKNSIDVDDFNNQASSLREALVTKKKLQKEIGILNEGHASLLTSLETLQSSNLDLIASNSQLTTRNNELSSEVESILAANCSKEVKIDDASIRVLKAVASLTESDIRTGLEEVEAVVCLGKIRTHSALDVLQDHGLIIGIGGVRGVRYRLTPDGRAYYLKCVE